MKHKALLSLVKFILASGLIWQAAMAAVWVFREVRSIFTF